MLPDAQLPGSDAWWMTRLYRQLAAKQHRLKLLDDYYRGKPPLVLGSESLRSAFYRLQRVARSNFAETIIGALVERQAVRSIRTAAADDDDGDARAWAMFAANNLDVDLTDVLRMVAEFGEAYMAVGMPSTPGGQPIITAEDPRQTITASDDVNPRTQVAAFKLFHDENASVDYAYLWRPGRLVVARRPRAARPVRHDNLSGPPPPVPVAFSPSTFDIDIERSESYTSQVVPVVRFCNRGGVGEYELHTDLLDRINHMILQRIVIATLQAFRQRAIRLSDEATNDPDDPRALPTHDPAGKPIDYDDLFSADPGALWRLPAGAAIWESGQVDLTGILASVKDDVLHLATVTRTPFSMFTPDTANQSAEGAQAQREGLVFRVEDRNRIAGRALAQVISLGFQFLGDAERASVGDIIVDWLPAERYSLAEKAQADSQATSLPVAQRLRVIWGLSPAEVAIAMAQHAADAMRGALTSPPASSKPISTSGTAA